MKIIAVSIPEFSERHNYIKRHLESVAPGQWRVVGVHGAKLRASASTWPHNPSLRDSQVGCALSHVAACQEIVRLGLPYALVVEDDVVLPQNILDILEHVGREIRPNEMISLYSRAMQIADYSANDQLEIGAHRLVYPLDSRVMRTAAAYVVGHEAARRIADDNDPVERVADDWRGFEDAQIVTSFRLVYPLTVRLKPFPSTLAVDRGGLVKNAVFGLFSKMPGLMSLRSLRRRAIERKREGNIRFIDKKSPYSQAIESE